MRSSAVFRPPTPVRDPFAPVTKESPTVNVSTATSAHQYARRRWLQVPAVALGVIVLAAACGSSSSSTKSAAQTPQNGAGSSSGAGGGGAAGGGARPGTTGKISQVNPSSIFVQETSDQVTVNYTGTTTFSQTLTTTAAALKAGDCVTATAAASTTPSTTPSASPSPVTALTATSVIITKTSGTCTIGTGGRGPGGAFPSGRPSGRVRPSGSPSFGAGGGGAAFGRAAFGTVASVGNGTFVVNSTRAGKTSSVTVTTTSGTTFREEATATKADLKVGLCATAIGTTDDTGAVTARTIALSTPTSSGCTQLGFGGGFGRFRQGAGASGGAG